MALIEHTAKRVSESGTHTHTRAVLYFGNNSRRETFLYCTVNRTRPNSNNGYGFQLNCHWEWLGAVQVNHVTLQDDVTLRADREMHTKTRRSRPSLPDLHALRRWRSAPVQYQRRLVRDRGHGTEELRPCVDILAGCQVYSRISEREGAWRRKARTDREHEPPGLLRHPAGSGASSTSNMVVGSSTTFFSRAAIARSFVL